MLTTGTTSSRTTSRFIALQLQHETASAPTPDRAWPEPAAEQLQALRALLVEPLAPADRARAADQLERYTQQLEVQIAAALHGQIAERLETQLTQRVACEVAQKVQFIIEQWRLARRRQFGPASQAQHGLFNEAEALAADEGDALQLKETATPSAPPARKARGHRRALPPHLPRVEVIIDVPEQARRDAAGAPMVCIGQEVSEQLDIIPMQIRVIRTIRPRWAPADGGGAPVAAAMPARLLPCSNFSAGFWATLLAAKYADGLPLYRFTRVLERSGVSVPRQSLARAVIGAARALQPLHNLMGDALLDSAVIHMDETRVQVLKEPGRAATAQSYMWVQRGSPPDKPVVLFDYRDTRSGTVPLALLEGWRGYLMSDGYEGYAASARVPGVEHLACMAHARRKFVEAARAHASGKSPRTDKALAFFAQLYAIEKSMKDASSQERLKARQEESIPVLNALHTWLQQTLPLITPRSKLGQALAYLSRLWPRPIRYTERGDLPIDNNPCERAIRPFVLGRKGWLFADTPAGAHASALVYSLVETARANAREPYAWLRWALERLPLAAYVDEMEALLPWNTQDQELAMNLKAAQDWG